MRGSLLEKPKDVVKNRLIFKFRRLEDEDFDFNYIRSAGDSLIRLFTPLMVQKSKRSKFVIRSNRLGARLRH